MNHLLSIEELDRAAIERIVTQAERFAEVSDREIKKVPALRGRMVERGCQENLAAAIAEFQLSPDHVHDPFNLFMKTGLDGDDRPFYEDPDARAGDYIELRAEIDCLVALTVCTSPCIGDETHPLQVQIYDPE